MSDIPPVPLAGALAAAILAIAKFAPKIARALKARESESAADLAIARLPGELTKLGERIEALESERERSKSVRQKLASQGLTFERRIVALEAQNIAWQLANVARALKIQDIESQVSALRSDLASLRKSHDDCDARGVAAQVLTARHDEQLEGLTTRLDDVAKRVSNISSARWSAHGNGTAE